MSMSATRLGDAIANAIAAVNPEVNPEQLALLKTYWRPIAGAIITEITGNAQVAVNVTSVTGVLPGGGVSGPGTGTGTVS